MSAAVTRARALRCARPRRAHGGQRGGGASRRTAPRPACPCASTRRAPRRRPILGRSRALGADLQLVDGHIGDAGKLSRAFAAESGWFERLHAPRAVSRRGHEDDGLRARRAARLAAAATRSSIRPAAARALIGIWKAFAEMRDGGWLPSDARAAAHGRRAGRRLRADRARLRGGRRPRDAVGESGHVRGGLRVPGPLGDRLLLRALRESEGDAAAVSEDVDPRRDARARPSATGIDAAPEGGCALAVARAARARGTNRRGRRGRGLQHRQRRVVPSRDGVAAGRRARRDGGRVSAAGEASLTQRTPAEWGGGERVAILDPFSGICRRHDARRARRRRARPEWLRALPATLGLDGVTVRRSREVSRGDDRAAGRSTSTSRRSRTAGTSRRSGRSSRRPAACPRACARRGRPAFTAIAEQEAEIHGDAAERGAPARGRRRGRDPRRRRGASGVSHQLGVERVFCGAIQLGDGIRARRARRAARARAGDACVCWRDCACDPAPTGPASSSRRPGPRSCACSRPARRRREYVPRAAGSARGRGSSPVARTRCASCSPSCRPRRSGDATDEDDGYESLVLLSADVDDMSGELLAAAADAVRDAGALDVVLLPTLMKKGRPGARIDVLARREDARDIETPHPHAHQHDRRAHVERRETGARTRERARWTSRASACA